MATWDGSYPEPDGSNYYINSTRNPIPVNISRWDYYLPNVNTYVQSRMPYSFNTSVVFQHNTPNFYNHIDKNISPLMPNVMSTDSYPSSRIQSFSNKELSEMQINNTDNQPLYLYEDKILTHKLPSYYNRNKNFKNYSKYQDINKSSNYQVSDIVEYSNLHATASEFLPTLNERDKRINLNINNNTKRQINQNHDFEQTLHNIYFKDNKLRYNDKKFENKKDADKRLRDRHTTHFQKEIKKDCAKNYNSRKFHNNKYICNKNFFQKSRNNRYVKDDIETTILNININNEQEKTMNEYQDNFNCSNILKSYFEENNLQYSKNSKICSSNDHENRYDKKERYNPKNFRNSWDFKNSRDSSDNKNNYSDCNEYSNMNYSKNNYKTRENRCLLRENKNKKTDWRQKMNATENKSTLLKHIYHKKYELDDASQREKLTEQLNRGQLECLVCCDFIRQVDYVWSCKNCYHVFHLKCVQKWALSSQDGSGWRCPTCQNVTSDMPSDYECFCGKTRIPDWNRRDIAHSCGDVCGRIRMNINCVHRCTLLCHPGSCPPCLVMVTKSCGCGRMSQTQKCSIGSLLQCNEMCNRVLNCGVHKCETTCHHGSCESCDKIIKQECFCGKRNREVTCTLDLPPMYSCKNVCGKILDCNNHRCKNICHPGQCGPCVLKPETVTNCCCGKTILTIRRKNCLEPIPTCENICCKPLKCGQPSNPHTCQVNCHNNDCPECGLITKVKCRCGYMDKEIPCKELRTKADDARCEKKCTKKRSCGKHKCNQMCCIDLEHMCPLPCSKNLSCGRHKCEKTCHKGRCQPCWRSSFDELYCECGAAVIYPPIACGTRRPVCEKPCSRRHPCGHEVLHNCHNDSTCPPCTVLTQKWCYGEHELRKAVPCYINEISCGLPCGKPISCGKHKCTQICHLGDCEKPGQTCIQPCSTSRESCGHMCAAPCHKGKCPDTSCKETVKVTCQCGHRTMSRICAENAREYQRITSGILASKMADVQLGHSIDLEEVFGQRAKKQNQLKTLECNDECKIIERNRRLILGLQIDNPELCGKLMPKYSEHMRQWAKKDPTFCQMVHEKLTELVHLAKTSKQKSRSYSFESMNRDKRHFVHESCEHFGCESQAYDQEPKRNIVATAVKDKCWLPSYSLIELLQRENGQRKVPRPMLNKSKINNIDRNGDIPQGNTKKSFKSLPKSSISSSRSPELEIDYFNYNGS